MENNSQDSKALQPIQSNTVSTVMEDALVLADKAENIVDNISYSLNNFGNQVKEITQIYADVRKQCAQLNHDLDCLMVKAQRDLRLYEQSLPVLDKQFTSCQNRLDKLIDKAMDMMIEDLSESSLKRQEMTLSLIEMVNSTLHTLISKLMPNL